MSRYIQLTITVTGNEQKEMLIAQLAAAGADGFEEEGRQLKTFVAEDAYDATAVISILQQYGASATETIIEETNWNAQWEAGFSPVQVDDFCAIRAGFHAPVAGVQYDIIITPKMSFGTGHHATTHMMVNAMRQLEITGKSVFDFGTGTGVLAILAEKMGAGTITAIDNDAWSIANANENFIANNCHKILLFNEMTIPTIGEYDIILANINRHVILEQLPVIKQHLSGNGVVVFSGLLTGDKPLVLEQAQQQQLELQHEYEMNGWICLLMVMGQ